MNVYFLLDLNCLDRQKEPVLKLLAWLCYFKCFFRPMRVSSLYLVNMLTLSKSEVITVLDMCRLVELNLGLWAIQCLSKVHLFPCLTGIWGRIVIDICPPIYSPDWAWGIYRCMDVTTSRDVGAYSITAITNGPWGQGRDRILAPVVMPPGFVFMQYCHGLVSVLNCFLSKL